ncbi:MAG: sensor histidine kinase [Haloferacaceae archaeon]
MDLPAGLAQETLDALSLNLAVLDSDGEIVASNRAWRRFGNFNGIEGDADTVGQNYLRVTERAENEYAARAARGIRAVLDADRDTFQLEYPCHSPDEKRWFLMHASRFAVDGASYVVVAHENITQRKRTELAVERRNDDLEAFARLLSHDLRNPLNVAQGQVEMLSDEAAPERVEALRSALDRMDELVGDALTLVRDDANPVDPRPVSVRASAEEAWTTVETRDATLTVEGDRELRADPGLLRNVFENLFRNAVEHAGEEVHVTVGLLEDGFYVEDDGPGVPEHERDDVFEIGFTTSADGTGFGLGIVRHVVEDHGWEIDLETGHAGGARFEISTRPRFPGTEQSRRIGAGE